jgi:hypothetical protein
VKRFTHIVLRLVLVFIPVLLTLPQARAQGDTVCAGQTSVWAVEEVPGDTYFWELYNDVTGLNLAVVPGNCLASEAYFVGGANTGDSVEVMCLVPGTYFIKVTATDSCTNNIKVGRIEVVECYSTAIFLEPEPVCSPDTAIMTIGITGGTGPWNVSFTDGTTIWTIGDIQASPYTFPLIPTPTIPGAYEYWIISVTNGAGLTNDTPSDPVTLIVKPKPVTSPIYRY